MKSLRKFFAIVSAAVIVLCEIQVPHKASAESENKEKRIIVSLGDSYSSGEGIEPFYGQKKTNTYDSINDIAYRSNLAYDSIDDIKNNLDWLAHRSTLAWSGQLVLDGLKMSEHPDNWYFEAVSGAEIKNLGVDESYLDNALEIINKKKDKQLKSGYIAQVDVQSEYNKQLAFSSPLWNEEKQQWEEKKWEQEKQSKTVSYIEEIKKDSTIQLLTYAYDYPLDEDIYEKYGIESKVKLETFEMPYQLDIFNNIEYGTVDYVTMTLSGNDVGFTEVVTKAVMTRINLNQLTDLLNSKLTSFDNKIKYYLYSAYSAIQDKAGKQANIIVAGYPKLFGYNALPVVPDAISSFIPVESREIINSFIPLFNNRIEQIVNDCRIYGGMNIYFVSVEEIFDGHGAYSDEAYINPLKLIQDEDLDWTAFPPVSAYSIHPNEKGAKAYAEVVQDKIDELEKNGLISGFIYEDHEKNWNSKTFSKIEKITAINAETGYQKPVYVNRVKNNQFEANSIRDENGWNELDSHIWYYDEDQITNTGYYSIVVPPGKYMLEVTYKDGTSFLVNKNKISPSDKSNEKDYAIIDVNNRRFLKNVDIDLEEECLLSDTQNYEWYLEPSIDADNIIVSDLDEDNFDSNLVAKYTDGFAPGDYSVFTYSILQKNGKYSFIDYEGESTYGDVYGDIYLNIDGTMCLVNNDEFFGFPGSSQFGYFVVPTNTHIIDYFSNEYYSGEKTVMVEYMEGAEPYKVGAVNDGISTEAFEEGRMNYFSSNGITAFKKQGKWGYFDNNCTQIIDFQCETFNDTLPDVLTLGGVDWNTNNSVFMASSGYIPVKINGKCGYYDTAGSEVIPVGTFEDVRPVHNGLAWVKDKKTGLWGVIKLPRTWQEIYKEKLNEFYNSNEYNNGASSGFNSGSMFDLCDVDGNGIPELLISQGVFGGATVYVYTVDENQLYELQNFGRNGEIFVSQKCAYIMGHYDHMGYITDFICQIDNTSCEQIIKLEHNCIDNIYSVDDIVVSESEYDKQSEKYHTDIDWESCGRKYNFDQVDEIL